MTIASDARELVKKAIEQKSTNILNKIIEHIKFISRVYADTKFILNEFNGRVHFSCYQEDINKYADYWKQCLINQGFKVKHKKSIFGNSKLIIEW